jgi:polysaccharide chain length determinant protein (PEP-CTERM system associated)
MTTRDISVDSGVEHYQEEPSRTLEGYWAIARRRRWWLVVPLFVTWVLVLGAGRFIPPKYRSETVIIIEQQRMTDQYVLPNIANDVQERLQSMTQQILSRTRLQGIIRRFRLYGQEQESPNSDAAVERMRQDIKIELVPAPGRPWELSAFKVSYSAPKADLAQQVTKELTSLFIQENLRSRQRVSEDTTEFLESQLQQASQDLAKQEQRLQEFKSEYLGELPEQLQNNAQILSALQSRLQAAEDGVEEANQQDLYLQSLLAQYQGLGTQNQRGEVVLNPTKIDERLEKLTAELADLSSRYTPSHPDVLRVKDEIAKAETLKRQLATDGQSNKSGEVKDDTALPIHAAPPASAPVVQLETQLRSNQLKITHREQEVKRLEQQIAEYQRRLNIMPLREQQLAAIARDYDQSRTNYQSLLAKKNQSAMATNMEKRWEGELFSVIDPPNLPQKPYWPERFKLSLMGLALGSALAVGATALMEAIDSPIDGVEELRSLLAVPVLVGIPILRAPREQRREDWRQRIEAITASALLAVITATTLFTYYRG